MGFCSCLERRIGVPVYIMITYLPYIVVGSQVIAYMKKSLKYSKKNYPKFLLTFLLVLFFGLIGNAQKMGSIWSINKDQIKKEDVAFYKSKQIIIK
mgnify:CR=1 FL=1